MLCGIYVYMDIMASMELTLNYSGIFLKMKVVVTFLK
jgi:hypothetical protein